MYPKSGSRSLVISSILIPDFNLLASAAKSTLTVLDLIVGNFLLIRPRMAVNSGITVGWAIIYSNSSVFTSPDWQKYKTKKKYNYRISHLYITIIYLMNGDPLLPE